MGILDWLYYVKPEKPPKDYVLWESTSDTSFTSTIKNVME